MVLFYTYVIEILFRWNSVLLSIKLHFKFSSVVMKMYYWNKLSPFFFFTKTCCPCLLQAT